MYRPKFINVAGAGELDYAALADAFFAGVESHEQAAAVWNAHLDQTLRADSLSMSHRVALHFSFARAGK